MLRAHGVRESVDLETGELRLEGGPRIGLQNLAQECARRPVQDWAEVVEPAVRAMLNPPQDPPASFEAAWAQLRLRLYPPEWLPAPGAAVSWELSDEVIVVLMYQLAGRAIAVQPRHVEPWGYRQTTSGRSAPRT